MENKFFNNPSLKFIFELHIVLESAEEKQGIYNNLKIPCIIVFCDSCCP